jgi:hypothetical protein
MKNAAPLRPAQTGPSLVPRGHYVSRLSTLTARSSSPKQSTSAETRALQWADENHDTSRLHALVSLLKQAELELPTAVEWVRQENNLTRTQIGELLGTSAAAASRRYQYPRP